jgi:hypothetical protein
LFSASCLLCLGGTTEGLGVLRLWFEGAADVFGLDLDGIAALGGLDFDAVELLGLGLGLACVFGLGVFGTGEGFGLGVAVSGGSSVGEHELGGEAHGVGAVVTMVGIRAGLRPAGFDVLRRKRLWTMQVLNKVAR